MKKIIFAVLAVSAFNGLWVLSSNAEECRDPHFQKVRAAMVSQNTKNIERVYLTGDCSLIPSVIAFTRHANGVVNQALADTNGACSYDPAPLSTAALEAQLRRACNSHAAAKANGNAPTSPQQKQAAKQPSPAPQKPVAAQQAGPPQNSGGQNCSTISGPINGQSTPSGLPCPGSTAMLPMQPSVTQNVANAPTTNPPPPSNGAATIESLRTLLPELGGLVDEVDREVNSPNIPPVSQTLTRTESVPTVSDSRPRPTPDNDSSSAVSSPNDENQNSSPNQDAGDDDYAEICRSESVKNGLKSLKQDFEEAKKNEGSQYGLRFFIKKLKLQWATLKKCARDPMQKAVIEKLEQDPIILDPQ
jgi:hypothetical protein